MYRSATTHSVTDRQTDSILGEYNVRTAGHLVSRVCVHCSRAMIRSIRY